MAPQSIDYSLIFSELQEPVLAIDQNGIIIQCNRATEEAFGYELEELAGKNISLLMPAPHSSHHDAYIQKYLSTGKKNIIGLGRKVECKAKSGKIFPVHLTVSEQKTKEGSIFIGLLRDLSEVEKTRSELSSLGEIINTSPHEVFILSRGDLQFLYINRTGLENLKYDSEEITSMSLLQIAIDHNPESAQALFLPLLSTIETLSNVKTRFKRKDNTFYPVSMKIYESRFLGQDVYVIIAVDESREIDLLNQLIHSSQMAAIGELAAGVGHEINNPLAIALAHMMIIQKQLKADPTQNKLLGRINKTQKALLRASGIVKDLKTFARVEVDSGGYVTLCSATQQTLELLKEIYQKDGIQIQFERPAIPVRLKGSTGRFQQVLLNLISNSRHALNQINTEDKKIEISIKNLGSRVELSVEDNGPGIPEEIVPKIFDPFFTTKPHGSGTGLGLSLCMTLANSMEANLIYSKARKFQSGARFSLTFPVKAQN